MDLRIKETVRSTLEILYTRENVSRRREDRGPERDIVFSRRNPLFTDPRHF